MRFERTLPRSTPNHYCQKRVSYDDKLDADVVLVCDDEVNHPDQAIVMSSCTTEWELTELEWLHEQLGVVITMLRNREAYSRINVSDNNKNEV